MKKSLNFLRLNLQLFAEGAGDGGTASGATADNGGVATSASVENAQSTDVQSASTVDRNSEFERLIKGEYKDLYDSRVADTVKSRLKGTKDTVAKYEASVPMLNMLADKYGVEQGDIKALSKAIEEDDSFYEEEALERGLTVKELKDIKRMERENSELKRQMRDAEIQKRADELYSSWMRDSEALKSVYPSFNLDAELENPRFVDLLKSNIDVRTAYEVLHKDEIIPAAMQFTAQEVERKIANKIAANGARPNENGMSSQSSAIIGGAVSQLSREARLDLIERARRGERIVL